MQAVKQRLAIWREVAWRPWWLLVTALFGFAANADQIADWFGAPDAFRVANVLPQLEGRTWLILWLFATVAVLLESIYKVTLQRNELRAELDKKRENQELSDKMSDHHEYAVHELLNKAPKSDDEIEAWQQKERQWRKSCLNDMRKYKCTKQEKRHVQTLGLIKPIVQGPTPAITHELNMLITRMSRIADIAGKYGS